MGNHITSLDGVLPLKVGGDPYKDGIIGDAYSFVPTGDRAWDEGTRLVPRNEITSKDYLGNTVALYGYRALVWDPGSDEKLIILGWPTYFIERMGYFRWKPRSSLLMDLVMINLDMMRIYMETHILSGTPGMMTCVFAVVL